VTLYWSARRNDYVHLGREVQGPRYDPWVVWTWNADLGRWERPDGRRPGAPIVLSTEGARRRSVSEEPRRHSQIALSTPETWSDLGFRSERECSRWMDARRGVL
jgi:hypothetical protein